VTAYREDPTHIQRFLPAAHCEGGQCTTVLAVFSGDVVMRAELTQAVAASVTVGIASATSRDRQPPA
jgi:hypothetical protein